MTHSAFKNSPLESSHINSKHIFLVNGWIFQDVRIHQFPEETEQAYKAVIGFPDS